MTTHPLPHYSRNTLYSRALAREVNYGTICFNAPGEAVEQILYFLHGGNGDDQQLWQIDGLQSLGDGTLDFLRARRTKIVLPFIGTSFMRGAFKTHFYDELVAEVESEPLSAPPARHISGLSMGGQAALSAFFERPEFFRSGSALFPTLIDFDFEAEAEAQAYCARNSIDGAYLKILLDEFKREFRTRTELDRSNPVAVAKTIDPQRLKAKKIFFEVGSGDMFGLAEGCMRLHEALVRRGIAHHHSIVPGANHDADFVKSRLAGLLSHVFSA